jgi:hypothetical protein
MLNSKTLTALSRSVARGFEMCSMHPSPLSNHRFGHSTRPAPPPTTLSLHRREYNTVPEKTTTASNKRRPSTLAAVPRYHTLPAVFPRHSCGCALGYCNRSCAGEEEELKEVEEEEEEEVAETNRNRLAPYNGCCFNHVFNYFVAIFGTILILEGQRRTHSRTQVTQRVWQWLRLIHACSRPHAAQNQKMVVFTNFLEESLGPSNP